MTLLKKMILILIFSLPGYAQDNYQFSQAKEEEFCAEGSKFERIQCLTSMLKKNDYSQAIAEIKKQLNEIDSESIKKELKEIKSQISELQSKFIQLDNRINTLSTQK